MVGRIDRRIAKGMKAETTLWSICRQFTTSEFIRPLGPILLAANAALGRAKHWCEIKTSPGLVDIILSDEEPFRGQKTVLSV